MFQFVCFSTAKSLGSKSTMEGKEVIGAVKEKCGKNLSEEISCDVAEITEGKASKISFSVRVPGYRHPA